ncbi:Protein of unknown function [Lactobacillus helveticus CIRM-BIA 951]|uniref:Uncharacterized protein n=1 Tax=Lactobacillus helveticus CIRM-BIA 951 TaxID=1226334 RepID=U6F1D0_LACHE|nr:Protein of unknown function [Lactobacillus helveticus CIRM-BIA 951]
MFTLKMIKSLGLLVLRF